MQKKFALLSCMFLIGCNQTGTGVTNNSTVRPIGVSFNWCSGSPAFNLTGVPKETRSLNFRMIDQQAPGFQHGGGSISYAGNNSIPCGALTGGTYVGPSPPPPQVHDYEWTVTALDVSGSVIGVGKATRKFPQ
jgi:phosphatidylethanolamine-binding protein (PEBP) family uncharacterized protein